MTYIFDFDGTLVNSMPVFSKNMIKILDENGLVYPDDVVKIITPLGYEGTAKYAISLGLNLSVEEFIEKAIDYMTFDYHNNIQAKNFVKEKLTELKENGNSLNVLTASPHAVLDKCLMRTGLYDLFDNIWSCDDFGTTKSNPEIYIQAAKRLCAPVTECVFVDDNVNAISTAKKAGMQTIGVFDESSSDYIEEMKELADKYINSFYEL